MLLWVAQVVITTIRNLTPAQIINKSHSSNNNTPYNRKRYDTLSFSSHLKLFCSASKVYRVEHFTLLQFFYCGNSTPFVSLNPIVLLKMNTNRPRSQVEQHCKFIHNRCHHNLHQADRRQIKVRSARLHKTNAWSCSLCTNLAVSCVSCLFSICYNSHNYQHWWQQQQQQETNNNYNHIMH